MIINDLELPDALWRKVRKIAGDQEVTDAELLERLLKQALKFGLENNTKRLVLQGNDLAQLQSYFDKILRTPADLVQRVKSSQTVRFDGGLTVNLHEEDLFALRSMAEGMSSVDPDKYIQDIVVEALQTLLYGSPIPR